MELRDHERNGLLLCVPFRNVFVAFDVADYIELLLVERLDNLLILASYDIIALSELELRVTKFEFMHPAETHWLPVFGRLLLVIEYLQGYSLLDPKFVLLLGDLSRLIDVRNASLDSQPMFEHLLVVFRVLLEHILDDIIAMELVETALGYGQNDVLEGAETRNFYI